MKRTIAGLIAAAGLVLGLGAVTIPAAQAGVSPDVTVQIKSTTGGCLKDQGVSVAYSVSSCSISSNFTRTGYNVGGVEVYTYKDGNGYCVTASGSQYEAGNCVAASTQKFLDPDPEFQSVYDISLDPADFMVKWPIGCCTYEALRDTQTDGYNNAWELT